MSDPAPREHPLREALHNEVHARPPEALMAPLRLSHIAMLTGEAGGAAELERIAALCRERGAEPPATAANFVSVDLGRFRMRWERHTEFSTYTFYVPGETADPFASPALAAVPAPWIAAIPGERLVAIHLALAAAPPGEPAARQVAALFPTDALTASLITVRRAAAWTDFRIGGDGFERIVVQDRGMSPRQAGRLVQRLLEIETYRIMALLALPLARATAPRLGEVEAKLGAITAAMTEAAGFAQEHRLLDELTALAAEIERLSAAAFYRFNAAKAYDALVERRIAELREERIEALPTIGEFMARRLAPAMSTCRSAADRLESLSVRITRAAQLLRARVEVALEGQNRDLLDSMNRRAQLQLRLQQTVEGLSVAAISYYLVGLVGYAAKALKAAGFARFDPDLAQGAAIPIVLVLVFLGVRRIRRHLRRA